MLCFVDVFWLNDNLALTRGAFFDAGDDEEGGDEDHGGSKDSDGLRA